MYVSAVLSRVCGLSRAQYLMAGALVLALPLAANAGTEVGAIPGSFAVSPTGAATYSIPISLPPGISGMAPHLALTYSSQGGNGLAGYGWNLSGLSVITVCNKTWAQDGINQPVSFVARPSTPNDFCLDGAKLVAASGSYGAGGTVYRKEVDDFSSIIARYAGGGGPNTTVGPQWFQVQTKDGLTYEYGATADSEIVAVGPYIASGVTVVRAWALDQVYDKFGNSVSFTYQQDTTNGDFWPVQITYTNHSGTAGPNTIVFKYDDLNSISPGLVWTSYLEGGLISQTKRLNEIDVDYNSTPTFAYYLGYNNTLSDGFNHIGTERSRLISVQECSGSTQSNCYPATSIGWQNGESSWSGGQVQGMGGVPITDAAHAAAIQLVDIDGDGRADVVYPGPNDWMVMFSNGSGFGAPQDSGVAVNSDTYSQALIIGVGTSGQHGLLVPMGTTWHLLAPQWTNGTFSFSNTDTGVSVNSGGGNAMVTDLNGDGLEDLVESDGSNVSWQENSDPGVVFRGAAQLVAGGFANSTSDVIQHQSQVAALTPDFDGSGRGGFMTLTITSVNNCNPDNCNTPPPPTYSWSINEGGGYSNGATQGPAFLGGINVKDGNITAPIFADLNGDGISDLLFADGSSLDGSGWTWNTYLSSGNGLVKTNTGVVWNDSPDMVAVDFSGNGRQSLFLTLNGGNATGTCPMDWGLVGYQGGVFTTWDGGHPSPYCDSGYATGSMRTGDVQGNGFTDLVWVENTNSPSQAYAGQVFFAPHKGPYPDLVTSISNGFGQTYNVSYAPLSNGASYTMGNVTSPTMAFQGEVSGGLINAPETRNFKGAIYVVQNYSANNGVGGTFTDSYSYSGALIDALGRGFLGFSETTAADNRLHATGDSYGSFTDTTYNQFFPLTGTPATAATWTNSGAKNQGNIRSYVTAAYTSLPTLGGAQYIYLQSSQSSDYELGAGSTIGAPAYRTMSTTNTPTLSTDGNAVLASLEVKTSTSPSSISSDTVTNFDYDDSANWCLVLPGSTTATRTNANGQLSRSVNYSQNTATCRENNESVTETAGADTQTLTTAYTYDTYGHVYTKAVTGTDSVTGSSTRTTTYGYDNSVPTYGSATNEFVVSIQNPLGQTATQKWNAALGVPLSATDPNNVTATFSYDTFGLKTGEVDGDGTSITLCYGLESDSGVDCGLAAKPSLSNTAYWMVATHYSSTNASGATGTTVYDAFGRALQSSTYLLGGTLSNTQVTYDSLGRTSATSTPYSSSPSTWTYPTYDSFDRAAVVYSPAGQGSGCSVSYQSETTCTTSYTYNGLITSVKDPKGNVTSSTSDAVGETLSVTDANSGVTSYSFDAFGDLLGTTDAANNPTTMSYDSWGRKTGMTDLNMGSWSYDYDAFGELTTQTDAKNQTTTLTYDALGRLSTKVESGRTGTDTWTYDGPNGTPTAPYIGKPYSLQSADGNYSRVYQYDSVGRPTEVDATISGTTYTTNTSYDTFGRVASVTYPSEPMPLADDPPVAVASVSPNPGVAGSTVTLNGSQSYDPDNGPQPLTYKWAQTAGPAETTADGSTAATPTFSINTAGTYSFTLTVSDSVLTSTASVSVTVDPAAITNLSATTTAPGAFKLSWTNPLGAGNNYIEQSINGGAFSELPSNNSPAAYPNPAPFSGYADGSYQFEVQTCANGACDAWTSPVSVTVLNIPGTPGTVTTSPNPATNSNVYNVSWTKPTGQISYYMVYTSVNGGAYDNGTNVGNPNPNGAVGSTQTWATSNNVNGTYTYKVKACNSAGCGNAGGAGTETVSLPVPTVAISADPSSITSGGSTTLSWTWTGSVAATYYILGLTNEGGTTSVTVSPPATKPYTVYGCNVHGCGPGAKVTVTVSQGCKTCSLVQLGVPTANNGNVTTVENTAANGMLSASGSGTLSFAIVTNAAHGTVALNGSNGIFTYTPANGYLGSDAFTFVAKNGGGSSSPATESIAVNPGTASVDVPALMPEEALAAVQQPAVLSEGTAPMPTDLPPHQPSGAPAFAGKNPAPTSTALRGTDDVRSRLVALRSAGLRREQIEITREQHRIASGDRYLNAKQQPAVFAAQVEPQTAAGGLESLRQALGAGVISPEQLGAQRLAVSGTSRFQVNYVYDTHENLSQVVNAANTNLIYWQGTAADAFGHITTEILGNGIVTGRTYDPNTGALQGEQSGVGTGAGVANRAYTWDADGNLNTRQDLNANLMETFVYDSLNRVKTATVSGASSSSLSLTYDMVGNITSKIQTGTSAGNMGTYTYDPSHPMRVTATSGLSGSYSYDANGNMQSDPTRTYSWNVDNLPTQISNSTTGVTTNFSYTPEGGRYFESSTGAGAYTLTEVNGLFEVYGQGGHNYYRNMIQAPTGTVAIYTVEDNSTVTTRYLTTDHLGSSTEISNEVGTVTERASYDTFGAKRDPGTWLPLAVGSIPMTTDITDKGYTGQQQLDGLGLIHMNGRVHDPLLGRFVSADPTVPDPFYSQAFNRYAYVYNNPLNATDPSGFSVYLEPDAPPPTPCPPGGCPPAELGHIDVVGHRDGSTTGGSGGPNSAGQGSPTATSNPAPVTDDPNVGNPGGTSGGTQGGSGSSGSGNQGGGTTGKGNGSNGNGQQGLCHDCQVGENIPDVNQCLNCDFKLATGEPIGTYDPSQTMNRFAYAGESPGRLPLRTPGGSGSTKTPQPQNPGSAGNTTGAKIDPWWWMGLLGQGNGGAGSGLTASEMQYVRDGRWRGSTGNWYNLGKYFGNQYGRTAATTQKIASGLRVAGKVSLVVGVGVSMVDYGHQVSQGNTAMAARDMVDLPMSAAALDFPVGTAASAVWFGGELLYDQQQNGYVPLPPVVF